MALHQHVQASYGNATSHGGPLFVGNTNIQAGNVNIGAGDDRFACLRDLGATDPSADKERIEQTKDKLIEASYSWVFDHPNFHSWYNSSSGAKILRISGGPGKGKTMTLIGIINWLKARVSGQNSVVLGYFFCQATDDRLSSATAVLKGLIYNILTQDHTGTLIGYLRKKHAHGGTKLFEEPNAFYVLREVLGQILDDETFSRFYLVIDALDECKNGLEDLLSLMSAISSRSTKARLLVASRNYPLIEEYLEMGSNQLLISFESQTKQVSEGIFVYIEEKIEQLSRRKKYNSDIKKRVKEFLENRAEGTYLFVNLVCKELERTRGSIPRILSVLESNPRGLDGVYEMMANSLRTWNDTEDFRLCQAILSIITVAIRPLSIPELVVIANLSEDPSSVLELISRCGSFLFAQDGIVYFVHQSAKDFLESTAGTTHSAIPDGLVYWHQRIVENSIASFRQRLHRDVCQLKLPGFKVQDVTPEQLGRIGDMNYPCSFWINHLQISIKNNLDFNPDGIVMTFMDESFLFWVEVMSLLQRFPDTVLQMYELRKFLKSPSICDILSDAESFLRHNGSSIQMGPLQIYASALVFTSKKNWVRRKYGSLIPEWLTMRPEIEGGRNLCFKTFKVPDGPDGTPPLGIHSVAFSPCGRLLACLCTGLTLTVLSVPAAVFVSHSAWNPGIAHPRNRENDSSDPPKQPDLAAIINFYKFPYIPEDLYFSQNGRRIIALCRGYENDNLGTVVGRNISSYFLGLYDVHNHSWVSTNIYEKLEEKGAEIERERLELFCAPNYPAALSPHGRFVAVAAKRAVWLINNTSASYEHLVGFDEPGGCRLAFSFDCRFLAVLSAVGIQIWDPDNRTCTARIAPNYQFSFKSSWITMSPGGECLAVVGESTKFYSRSHNSIREISIKAMSNGRFCFSETGRRIATVDTDARGIDVWDTETGKHVTSHTFQGLSLSHETRLPTLGLSTHIGDVDMVYIGDSWILYSQTMYSETLYAIDTETGRTIAFPGTFKLGNKLAISPSGDYIIAQGSRPRELRFWGINIESLSKMAMGEPMDRPRHTRLEVPLGLKPSQADPAHKLSVLGEHVWCDGSGPSIIVYSHDGLMTASGDGRKIILWRMVSGHAHGTYLWSPTRDVLFLPSNSIAFSPDDTRIVVISSAHESPRKYICIWETATGNLLKEHSFIGGSILYHPSLTLSQHNMAVVFSQDNTIIAFHFHRHTDLGAIDFVGVWDLVSPEKKAIVLEGGRYNNYLIRTPKSTSLQGPVFSTQGNLIAFPCAPESLLIYSRLSGKFLKHITILGDAIQTVDADDPAQLQYINETFNIDSRELRVTALGSRIASIAFAESSFRQSYQPALQISDSWVTHADYQLIHIPPHYTPKSEVHYQISPLANRVFLPASDGMCYFLGLDLERLDRILGINQPSS
ncbi:hypothetical protein ABW19_dt0203732 [Dactylella cylindrospora]|nr:hypothetical protein ABW19_dt0203732 [Dactylella cylindrospora]